MMQVIYFESSELKYCYASMLRIINHRDTVTIISIKVFHSNFKNRGHSLYKTNYSFVPVIGAKTSNIEMNLQNILLWEQEMYKLFMELSLSRRGYSMQTFNIFSKSDLFRSNVKLASLSFVDCVHSLQPTLRDTVIEKMTPVNVQLTLNVLFSFRSSSNLTLTIDGLS